MKWLSALVCLAVLPIVYSAAIPATEVSAKAAQGLHLISLKDGADPVWKTEAEVLDLIKAQTKFIDVTEIYDAADSGRSATLKAMNTVLYEPLSQMDRVNAMLADPLVANLQTNLASLTAYNNRYYKATTGANASNWILSKLQTYAAANSASGASAAQYTHSAFVQKSIIATIPGTDPSLPRVIIGAHLDSVNSASPTSGRSPGADDDGSGTVTVMEAFRVLVANGFKGRATVEFHFYAGEEGGLLGSGAIAKAYKAAGTQIKGMLNMDMTAYVKPGTTEAIGMMPDYTQSALTTTVKNLVTQYCSIPWVTSTACGYACSDHASWYNQGFPAAMAFEGSKANMNPNIHTTSDTINVTGFSWTHMIEFVKLSIAFATELSA